MTDTLNAYKERSELINRLLIHGYLKVKLYNNCVEFVFTQTGRSIHGINGTFTHQQVAKAFGIPESAVELCPLIPSANGHSTLSL